MMHPNDFVAFLYYHHENGNCDFNGNVLISIELIFIKFGTDIYVSHEIVIMISDF